MIGPQTDTGVLNTKANIVRVDPLGHTELWDAIG